MKLCAQIQTQLSQTFSQVLVADERGDGHFVQVVCVDETFATQNAVARTRTLYKAVAPWQQKVHAWSVKGFTPAEWAEVEPNFQWQGYVHYPKM